MQHERFSCSPLINHTILDIRILYKPEGFLWNNLLIWEMFFGFGLSIESRRNEEGQAFLNKIFCNFWNKKSQALLGGRSLFRKSRSVQKIEFDDVDLKICSRSLKICLEVWKSEGRAPTTDGRTDGQKKTEGTMGPRNNKNKEFLYIIYYLL